MNFLQEKKNKLLTKYLNYLNDQSSKFSNFKYLLFSENQASSFSYKVTSRKSHRPAQVYTAGYLSWCLRDQIGQMLYSLVLYENFLQNVAEIYLSLY